MTETFRDFIDEFEEKTNTQILPVENELIGIPTGSLSLDACIGVGGIPTGKLTILAGDESTGKTSMALFLARNAIQILGMKVLYVDAENMLDIERAKQIIGEKEFLNNVLLIQPDTAEQVLELTGKAIKSGEFGLVILDSTGALSPKKEKDEEDFEKQDVSLVSKLLTKFLRIYFYWLRRNNVALLMISQIRDKIGGFARIKMYDIPGGHALKHAASLIIWFFKDRPIMEEKVQVGINVRFVVKKNKLASPFRGYIFGFRFEEGIETLKDIIDFSETLGVLRKNGPFIKYGDVVLGKGVKNAITYLQDNPKMVDQLRKDVMENITTYKVEELETLDDEVPEELEEQLG